MQLSLVTCLAQEARQREIAESAPLANVRVIATRAAAAWATEAGLAKKREDRAARVATNDAATAATTSAMFDDTIFSENPDSGLADG